MTSTISRSMRPCRRFAKSALKANPRIASIVKPLMESFDRATLQALNARVQINGESAESVARDYLRSTGLLK